MLREDYVRANAFVVSPNILSLGIDIRNPASE